MEELRRAPALAEEVEDPGDDIMAWFLAAGDEDDEEVGDLTALLDETENGRLAAEKMKFIANPYSSAMIFQSSSSYVTINGNEESCGSSFSDSESSVMASVDICGVDMRAMEKWRSWSDERLAAEGGMEGSDGLSWDEEDLARFVGEGEMELGFAEKTMGEIM